MPTLKKLLASNQSIGIVPLIASILGLVSEDSTPWMNPHGHAPVLLAKDLLDHVVIKQYVQTIHPT